mgnify:FL=1|tara:strand:- start:270 stop:431 length:162 start_codon:yes stop_codon:yes gene_type:complete
MKKTVMPYAMVVISIGDHPTKKAIGISKLNNLEKMDLMLWMLDRDKQLRGGTI